MDSRKFQHKVLFQSKTLTSDGAGGQAESWTDFVELRADIINVKQDESNQEYITEASQSFDLFLWYYPGLSVEMRVIFENRIFNIVAIRDQRQRRRALKITVRELIGVTNTP